MADIEQQVQDMSQETEIEAQEQVHDIPQETEVEVQEQTDAPTNTDPDSTKKWYVVRVASGYEQRVKSLLEERVSRSEVSDRFGKEILVPSKEVVEIRGGSKRTINRKLYPGCVFVEVDMNEEAWHLIRYTSQVLGFIGGTNKAPRAMREDEMNIIRKSLTGQLEAYPFEVGEVVWIMDGPFSGFSGTVEEIDSAKSMLQVSVSILGRATPVEIEFSHVQKN